MFLHLKFTTGLIQFILSREVIGGTAVALFTYIVDTYTCLDKSTHTGLDTEQEWTGLWD